MTLEINIEKPAVRMIERRGFFAVKLGFGGLPDRLILGRGWVCFMEFKTATGRLGPAQKIWKERLERLGFCVYVPRSVADAEAALLRHDPR